MRTNHHHEPRDPDTLRDMGYETRDVDITGVRWTAIAFTGLMVFAMTVVGLWYWLLGPGSKRPPGLATGRQLPSLVNPNNPLIQNSVTAKTDIMTIRREESRALQSAGYIDQSKGIVHIPIDQAMDIVASGRYITTGSIVPARTPGTGGATGQTNLNNLTNESNLPNPSGSTATQNP